MKPQHWLGHNVEACAGLLVLPSISTTHLLTQQGPEEGTMCLLNGLLAQEPGRRNSLVSQHAEITRVFAQGPTSPGFLGHTIIFLFFFLFLFPLSIPYFSAVNVFIEA